MHQSVETRKDIWVKWGNKFLEPTIGDIQSSFWLSDLNDIDLSENFACDIIRLLITVGY